MNASVWQISIKRCGKAALCCMQRMIHYGSEDAMIVVPHRMKSERESSMEVIPTNEMNLS